jgi:nucleoside-diphosphate-sugar epimerase
MEAYWASKAWSRIASHDFITSRKPHFELVNILPTVVIGPDALATRTEELIKGTRAMVMSPVLGQKQSFPCVGSPVHVDDVARAYVDALKPGVPGNADYILASDTPDGVEWDSASEIARRLFPEAVEKGVLPLEGTLPSQDFKIDDGTTKRAFGWECQSYEKTMEGLIEQYIELKAKEE